MLVKLFVMCIKSAHQVGVTVEIKTSLPLLAAIAGH